MTRIACSLAAIAAVFALTTPAVHAQAIQRYPVTIPMPFELADHSMPAGTYQVVPVSEHSLRLLAADGHVLANLPVFPVTEGRHASTGQLRFHKVGAQYFLREFSAPADGRGLHTASRLIVTPQERKADKELVPMRALNIQPLGAQISEIAVLLQRPQ